MERDERERGATWMTAGQKESKRGCLLSCNCEHWRKKTSDHFPSLEWPWLYFFKWISTFETLLFSQQKSQRQSRSQCLYALTRLFRLCSVNSAHGWDPKHGLYAAGSKQWHKYAARGRNSSSPYNTSWIAQMSLRHNQVLSPVPAWWRENICTFEKYGKISDTSKQMRQAHKVSFQS